MSLTIAQSMGDWGGDGGKVMSHISPYRRARLEFFDITFDSSYPTGGESFSHKLVTTVFSAWFDDSDGTGSGTYYCRYDKANNKILVFNAADATQVSNGTDLSAFTTRAMMLVEKV